MRHSCYYCSYFHDNYCEDRDCIVDPTEPECNYED